MFTWFEKLIAGLWIFCMLFLGSIVTMGQAATSRHIDTYAGVLVEKVGDGTKWLIGQVKLGLVEPVVAEAQLEAIVAKLLIEAAMRLLNKLLVSVFNAAKSLSLAAGDYLNQFASVLGSSNIANDVVSIIGGRQNVCGIIEDYVSDFIGKLESRTSSSKSLIENAFNQTQKWFDTNIASVFVKPVPVQAQINTDCYNTIYTGAPDVNTSDTSSPDYNSKVAQLYQSSLLSIADGASTRKGGEGKLQNQIATLESKATERTALTEEQCRDNLIGLMGRSLNGSNCVTFKDTVFSEAETKEKLTQIASGATIGAANATSKVQQATPSGGTTMIVSQNTIGPKDKVVPTITEYSNGQTGYRFSGDVAGLASDAGNIANTVDGASYVVAVVDPISKGDQLQFAAGPLNALLAKSGGGGDDSGNFIDTLVNTVLKFFEEFAISLLDDIVGSVSYIACGALNFQDFCNGLTLASSNLETNINNYFTNLQSSNGQAFGYTDNLTTKLANVVEKLDVNRARQAA